MADHITGICGNMGISLEDLSHVVSSAEKSPGVVCVYRGIKYSWHSPDDLLAAQPKAGKV